MLCRQSFTQTKPLGSRQESKRRHLCAGDSMSICYSTERGIAAEEARDLLLTLSLGPSSRYLLHLLSVDRGKSEEPTGKDSYPFDALCPLPLITRDRCKSRRASLYPFFSWCLQGSLDAPHLADASGEVRTRHSFRLCGLHSFWGFPFKRSASQLRPPLQRWLISQTCLGLALFMFTDV